MTGERKHLVYPKDFLVDHANIKFDCLSIKNINRRYQIKLNTHFLIQEIESENKEPVHSQIGNLHGSLKNTIGSDFIGIVNNGGLGNKVIEAISHSLACNTKQCDDAVYKFNPDKIPIIWGTIRGNNTLIKRAEKYHGQWIYIDHAYLNRGHEAKNYRFGINKLFAYPENNLLANFDNKRIKRMNIKLKDWKTAGGHIVICPPSETIMNYYNCFTWLDETLKILKSHTDRPLVVRSKPKYGDKSKPLEMDLKNAHALVTHCSNAAVEAVIEGIPVFISDHSVCKYVGSTELSRIEEPIYAERNKWLNYLSYAQFSLDELKDRGYFKDHISLFCEDIKVQSDII